MILTFVTLVPTAASLAPAVEGTDPPGAWKTTTIRPVRYDLDLALDFGRSRFAASGRVIVRNGGDAAVTTLPFLLHRLLRVQSVRDAAGAPLAFSQTVTTFEDWDVLQANFIEVRPAEPLLPSASITLSMAYEGTLAGYVEAMPYVKDRVDPAFTILRSDAFAFPQPGVPSDAANRKAGLPKFDYDLRITVPPTHTAVNGGRTVARTPVEGGVRYAFANLKPAWRMDVAVARYETLEDAGRGLRVCHFPEDAEGARRILTAMGEALDLYTSWFGPVPGPSAFTLIEVPEGYGSQADVSAILQMRPAFLDPERMGELYHELAHSWSVDSRDPLPARFESEGMAMFLQELVREKREGRRDAVAAGMARCREAFRRACAADPARAKIAMIDYGRTGETDLSYRKGMIFFALLHRSMGERDFLAASGAFARQYRERGATAAEFEAFFRSRSRADLSTLLADWVHGTASSDLLLGSDTLEAIAARYAPPTSR